MDIIVVGCGRVGAELASRLFQQGHKVSVIDQNGDAFRNLPIEFRGRTIEGEALNLDILRRAGIETASGLAAVSNIDSLNVVVAHIARSIYNIPNVVVRNYDAHWRSMYEAFGLQVISSASWGAQRIMELLQWKDLRAVFGAGNGEVELFEVFVPQEWVGHSLKELLQGSEVVPAALTRQGRAVLPNESDLLQYDDILLVSATEQGLEALRQKLNLGRR